MDDKKHKNALKQFFHNKRDLFQSLQDSSFDRSEKWLLEVMKIGPKGFNYPIPSFVPAILAWLFMILFPLVLILDPESYTESTLNLRNTIGFYLPLILAISIFVINQKYLVPSCIFKKHYIKYFIWNAFLIGISLFIREVVFFLVDRNPNDSWGYFFNTYCFSFVKGHFSIWTIVSFATLVSIVCVICVFYHIIIRQVIRAFITREQKRAELQYELDFLKNQLSPHFLFNTLNNISALIQIDPKRAESSMAKLSKLLRVMLYQTSDDLIPINDDIDILRKYADLEKLRLDESFDFTFDVDVESPNSKIAPLIAMPLMENALKHSINPNGQSFAHIRIEQKANLFTFMAENSNFPRKSSSKASGLGLATFKKRLELLYPNHYEYSTQNDEQIYRSILKITLQNEQE